MRTKQINIRATPETAALLDRLRARMTELWSPPKPVSQADCIELALMTLDDALAEPIPRAQAEEGET